MLYIISVFLSRERRNGLYYETSWRAALATTARMISITSFNEWHEVSRISTDLIEEYRMKYDL
jgi:hypothetical protein